MDNKPYKKPRILCAYQADDSMSERTGEKLKGYFSSYAGVRTVLVENIHFPEDEGIQRPSYTITSVFDKLTVTIKNCSGFFNMAFGSQKDLCLKLKNSEEYKGTFEIGKNVRSLVVDTTKCPLCPKPILDAIKNALITLEKIELKGHGFNEGFKKYIEENKKQTLLSLNGTIL